MLIKSPVIIEDNIKEGSRRTRVYRGLRTLAKLTLNKILKENRRIIKIKEK